MPKQISTFAEWYPKVKDQATICVWVNCNEDSAARNAILLHTCITKLQKKIIARDLSLRYGLAMEHSDKKVKELGRNQG